MKKDLRMYILVNQDVEINKGKLAGQVGHAVSSYMYKNHNEKKDLIDEYMNNDQKKIVLSCPQSTLEKLEKNGYISVRDKGWTDLEPDTLTCVNLGILDYNNMKKEHKFSKFLKLLK